MLAEQDLRLTRETIEELRARGELERARAIEAVYELARTADPDAAAQPGRPRNYLTVAQAARALGGIRRRLIEEWIKAGKLPVVLFNGQRRVLATTLFEVARREWGTVAPPPTGETDIVAGRLQHEWVLAGLSADQVTRLEQLYEKRDVGQRLSRAERAEIVALERKLTGDATRRLVERVRELESGPTPD